jgi:hypothetical protein
MIAGCRVVSGCPRPAQAQTFEKSDDEAEESGSLSELLSRGKGVISQGLTDTEWFRAESSSGLGNFRCNERSLSLDSR